MSEKKQAPSIGLYNKYHITRTDGGLIPDNARFFCLRYDQDTDWGRATRGALYELAINITHLNPQLSKDILQDLRRVRHKIARASLGEESRHVDDMSRAGDEG